MSDTNVDNLWDSRIKEFEIRKIILKNLRTFIMKFTEHAV